MPEFNTMNDGQKEILRSHVMAELAWTEEIAPGFAPRMMEAVKMGRIVGNSPVDLYQVFPCGCHYGISSNFDEQRAEHLIATARNVGREKGKLPTFNGFHSFGRPMNFTTIEGLLIDCKQGDTPIDTPELAFYLECLEQHIALLGAQEKKEESTR